VKKIFLLLLLAVLTQNIWSSGVSIAEVGKVTGVYRRGKIIVLTLELDLKLPISLVVYIGGKKQIPAVLKDYYAVENGRYVYEATVTGQQEIIPGDRVYATGEKSQSGTEVYLKLDRRATFVPKEKGTVLATYGKQVHIDRGSLHEVRERDIYAIYDSSGNYKGKVELAGIGDYQSIGSLFTNINKGVDPGDTVLFMGQRKFVGIGLAYTMDAITKLSVSTSKDGTLKEDYEKELPVGGGGLTFDWTFKGGWGFRLNVGTYGGQYNWKKILDDTNFESGIYEIYYSFPFTIKKYFFYPHWIVPYIGTTIGYVNFWVVNGRCVYTIYPGYDFLWQDSKRYEGLFVAPSLGVELFSTRLFHVLIDGMYLWTPEIGLRSEKYSFKKWIFSIGVTTNW